MRALLSIDYTFDFVADEGRLTTGAAGQAIEAALVARTQPLSKPVSMSFLPLIVMRKQTTIILKTACSHPTILRAVRGDIFMVV